MCTSHSLVEFHKLILCESEIIKALNDKFVTSAFC
jgi:hypothetical protein